MESFARDKSDLSFTHYFIIISILVILFWYFNINSNSRCIIIAEEQISYI